MSVPKLSVCLISYNQEKYIRQALDGIVMQQYDFEVEVVISDDMSTDKTPDIIQEYASCNPSFRVLKSEKNLGMHRNWEKAIRACNGEYIALIEGDDFWNDPLKLQKQVNILEGRKEVAISFTNAHILNEVTSEEYPEYLAYAERLYDVGDLLEVNFIPTCSTVFRNHLFKAFPEAYFRSPYADWIIHVINAKEGKIHFLNEKACTYRINSGGVYGQSNERTRLERKVKVYNCICEILKGTEWYSLAKEKKKDARYTLKRFYLDRKEYIPYIAAHFL